MRRVRHCPHKTSHAVHGWRVGMKDTRVPAMFGRSGTACFVPTIVTSPHRRDIHGIRDEPSLDRWKFGSGWNDSLRLHDDLGRKKSSSAAHVEQRPAHRCQLANNNIRGDNGFSDFEINRRRRQRGLRRHSRDPAMPGK
jgi:hypothetical protein